MKRNTSNLLIANNEGVNIILNYEKIKYMLAPVRLG